ncbi:hypothetical protein [Glaciecola sp. 1036]|uniref:hypothetical protein n=1 Tax=Alteromonadaceae TaxID=72275 RepID=UPI003D081863
MSKYFREKKSVRFAGVPHSVMENKSYIELSYSAKALLFEIAKQYNKHNNGKLCAIPEQLKVRGFGSATTVYGAVRELLDSNLIIYSKVAMKGSRQPHFYAITWEKVNTNPGFEMDIEPTNKPLRAFSLEFNKSLVA